MTLTSISGGVFARRRGAGAKRDDYVLTDGAARGLYAALAGFCLVRILAMFTVPFTDPTEARYAEIARKMVETGNWITPQFDYGVPFWGKPPLHTWLSAGGMELFGINEFAARLPIFLTSLFVLAIVWHWVSRNAGRNTALLSVTILASMSLFFGASAFVMTDMPMTLGCVMVMVGFWNVIQNPETDQGWGLAMFAGLAVGMLAKGPVVIVLCLIPTLIWLALTRNWRLLRHVPWIKGLALLIALTAPWYLAAEAATPGFLRYFIVGEHFERFVVPGWNGDLYGSGHVETHGMIWLFWLGTALPWSLVLIPLALNGRATVGAFISEPTGWHLYLLLWAVAPMILFTPAANILPAYVLPGLPASAILIILLSHSIHGNYAGMIKKSGFALCAGISFAFFSGLAVIAGLAPDQINLRSQKYIVAAAVGTDPDRDLFFASGRNYSGEFYTQGKAKTVGFGRDLRELIASDLDFYIIVPQEAVAKLGNEQFSALTDIGTFGRYLLFTSASDKGPN